MPKTNLAEVESASVSSDRSAQDRGFAQLTAPNSKALIKDTLKDRLR